MARTRIDIDTVQAIYDSDDCSPLVGSDLVETPYDFPPWKWDDRMWTDVKLENLNRCIPTLWDPPIYGLSADFFQSGVANAKTDIEVLEILRLRSESLDQWTARINHGHYFRANEKRYLFSDTSIVQRVDPLDNEGSGTQDDPVRNTLVLAHIPKGGVPIQAIIWRRDSYDNPRIDRFIEKKIDFTGLVSSSNIQESTRGGNAGAIRWKWVDIYKHEFITSYTNEGVKLTFNKDMTFLIGKSSITSSEDLEYCEYLGESSGKPEQLFLTRHFPIVNNQEITLYVGDRESIWMRLQDLGSHRDRLLPGQDEIRVNMQGHGFRVNTVDEPLGFYELDTDTGELTFVGTPPPAGTRLWLRYRPTVEVTYEVDGRGDDLIATNIDIHPLHTSLNRGFVYITEQDMRVASIVLSAERPEISDDVYGPLFIGTDYSFLVATVYDRLGSPIPGVEVTFYFPDIISEDDDFGRLGGHTSEMTATSNESGKARLVYTPPHSVEKLGTYFDHPDGDSVLHIPSGSEISPESATSLYLFAVYNDDPWSPWDEINRRGGKKVVKYVWDDEAIHPKTGAQGAYVPMQPNNITQSTLEFDDNLDATTGTLAAYWVSAGKDISVQAKAFSTLYGRDVESNQIGLRIDIPDYMKGVYVSQHIGVNPPTKIPFGFRLYDDYLSAASGLDGVTFLSINPVAGHWPVLWPDETDESMEATGELENTIFGSHRHGFGFNVV